MGDLSRHRVRKRGGELGVEGGGRYCTRTGSYRVRSGLSLLPAPATRSQPRLTGPTPETEKYDNKSRKSCLEFHDIRLRSE